MINFRWYDVAVYIHECYVDYSYNKPPSFKYYEYHKFLKSIDKTGGTAEKILKIYLKHYYYNYHASE
jgi:hypothetical protein